MATMDIITINELEVQFHVGVPDKERLNPQRLLLSVELETDLTEAGRTDDLSQTIDYGAVSRRLVGLGTGRSWKLIESLASEIAALLIAEFGAQGVTVEIKKFIVPQARYVSVKLRRVAGAANHIRERIHAGPGGIPGGWR
jgi:dihydroneopterin aldolase